jgi:hypothetical protein
MNHKAKNIDKIYPRLRVISSAFFYRAVPISLNKKKYSNAEYIQIREAARIGSDDWNKEELFMMDWNRLHESKERRAEVIDFPRRLSWLKNYSPANLMLVPVNENGVPRSLTGLLYMLPVSIAREHGLGERYDGDYPRGRGAWPYLPFDLDGQDDVTKLQNAFSAYIWPFLNSSCKSSFSNNDPLIMLSNSLSYWANKLDSFIQSKTKEQGHVPFEDDEQASLFKKYKDYGITRPRYGFDLWSGEKEVRQITQELIEYADTTGRIREIIDSVKANRTHDDFSDKWSHAKEDFERSFYHKRNKVKVNFIEVMDDLPCFSDQSEFDENLMWEDLMATISVTDRRVVVMLRKGYTKYSEIADILGYKNHSPVSKAMKRIQAAAKEVLET